MCSVRALVEKFAMAGARRILKEFDFAYVFLIDCLKGQLGYL